MFDSNHMLELQHIARDRYQRAGGGGAQRVHVSSKAYDDAKGYRHMTAWQQLIYRTSTLWRQTCRDAAEDFRLECWIDVDGRYMRDGIPF